MDSKVAAATWALDRGVSVVICNGTQEKAIKTIIGGRKVGTFFTETAAGGPTPVDTLAENGKWQQRLGPVCVVRRRRLRFDSGQTFSHI